MKKMFPLKNKKLQGSSTVELCLIMPVILTLFTFLIYLSFFLYNRVTITANAYICALRGSQMEQESAQETYQQMKRESNKLMKGTLLSVTGYKEQIKVNGKKIRVTYEISQQVPGSLILDSLFYESAWSYQIEKQTKKLNPVFFIRNCRNVEGLKKDRNEGKENQNEGNL